jgi:hypothetical protein
MRMVGRLTCLGMMIGAMACARGPRPAAISSAEDERCSAIADTLSKYISEDALPFAHLVGSPRELPAPSRLQPGDSIAVEFVVFPNGTADTSSIQIVGGSDPDFLKRATSFATRSRFTPAQVSGCNVMSRYNVIVKSRR